MWNLWISENVKTIAYLVAKIGLNNAENEPSKVCQKVVRQLGRLS